MVTANQVREAIKAAPFRPFVVRPVDGRNYQVPHPDFAMLSPRGQELLFIGDDDGIHQIDMRLIVEVETPSSQLAPPGPAGNGA
jgi:hypothetical protein